MFGREAARFPQFEHLPAAVSAEPALDSTAGAVPSRAPRGRPDPATATELDGTVKWFSAEKGFGFVTTDDGGKDVFLHVSVVEKAGLATLPEGATVAMRVVETQKGREAISVALMS